MVFCLSLMVYFYIMSFEAFDTKKIDEYARQAKESWGKTDNEMSVTAGMKRLLFTLTNTLYRDRIPVQKRK